jgi:GNAT superfamily N-acetyltransferase
LDLVREYGLAKFAGRIIPWLFVRRYYFFSESLDTAPIVPLSRASFRFDLLPKKELPVLSVLRPHHDKPSVLQERLKEGHLCFVGRLDGRPIHIRWIFTKSLYVPYLRRTLLLSPGEVYADEAFTLPEFRGRGIFRLAGALLRLKLRELGYRRYTYIYASWQGMARTSMASSKIKPIAEVKMVPWPGHRKHFWKGSIQDDGRGNLFIASV